MTFNVYALNWNESRILPAFLHHYRDANRIIIYDNESTDDSVNIIKKHGREVITFSSNETFDDTINRDLKNNFWKSSVDDDVDYIIVQDLDEFLYFPSYPDDIPKALLEMKRQGFTCARAIGYNMYCSDAVSYTHLTLPTTPYV